MKRPPPRAPDPVPDDFRRRYHDLSSRFQVLLDRLGEKTGARSAFHRLSWLALQRSSSALALFRDGHVVLANSLWHDWSSARDGAVGWNVTEGARRRSYHDLGTLAATELEAIARGKTVTLRVERKDGRRMLRLRIERVASPDETTMGLMLGDDITVASEREAEMVSLREQVRKREQMGALGRMAAGVAHDLGNTLNALALRVQRLARSTGRTEIDEHLHAIDEAIEMMRSTLERLDRFSGRRTLPPQPVDLRKVIGMAVSLAGLRPGKRREDGGKPRVRVDVKLPRKLPRVFADANELCSVFVNLLLNARDAMPDGGRIRIDATVGKRRVIVRVCDEGPGFPPEQLPLVFEPFFTTKGARGTGLGLSLAYGFMESIGGSIRAANRPGAGAELTLELPVAAARSR